LVVDSVVELYLEYHLKVYRANGTHDFFAQQVDEWRAKLAETEDALRNIRRSYSVASIIEQQRIVTTRIGELQRELERGQALLASAKARVGSMSGREYPGDDESGAETSPLADGQGGSSDSILQERLDRLRAREESLLAVYTEDSSLVRKVREQIIQAQDELSGIPSAPAEPGASRPRPRQRGVSALDIQNERTSVAALNAQVAAVISQLAAAQDDLRELIDAELKIAQLEREKAVQEANYRTFTAGLERSRIDHELQAEKISNISILQGATRPLAPYDPKKQKKVLMALVLGILGGLGLAFVSEFYLDRSLKRPADIGRVLKVPTLVSIPKLSAKSVSLVRRLKATETAAGGGGPKWHIPLDVRHHYESLCARVLDGNGTPRCPETVGVTSCYRGEGVSTVASNLAAAICRQRNGRVLLVDAHAGTTGRKQLGSGTGPTLSSLQPDGNGNASVTQQSQYLLPSGDGDPATPQYYGRSAYEGIRAKAEESNYDYIVFDIPAILESSSGYELGGLMDKLIVVVESERVRREAAERAGELLRSADANVVGAVLNKRRHYVPRWLYRRV
jgi:Mrp family chromosome partitioning ATPase